MGGSEGGWEGKKGIVMEKKKRCRGDKYRKKKKDKPYLM